MPTEISVHSPRRQRRTTALFPSPRSPPAPAAPRRRGRRAGVPGRARDGAASAEKTASARGSSIGVMRRAASERWIRPLSSRSVKIASAKARQRCGSRPFATRAPRSMTSSFASSRPNWNAAAVATFQQKRGAVEVTCSARFARRPFRRAASGAGAASSAGAGIYCATRPRSESLAPARGRAA